MDLPKTTGLIPRPSYLSDLGIRLDEYLIPYGTENRHRRGHAHTKRLKGPPDRTCSLPEEMKRAILALWESSGGNIERIRSRFRINYEQILSVLMEEDARRSRKPILAEEGLGRILERPVRLGR
jgi:hypothetical protein